MSKKVLIVDDDPMMVQLLDKYLSEGGYEVLQATNGREALQVVLDEAPPIVVTDWMMPEMDGIELCRALRQHEGIRFVYIIIVTAHSEIERVIEAFDAGADDFLSKPVTRHELLARLRAGEHIARLESDLAKRTREIHRLNADMAKANAKLAIANDKLQRMATTDELTGLLNRREAMTRLNELWAGGDRYGHHFACIMLDIDHFKRFNDTYGHAVGDMILRETAILLRENVRATDIVCRIGGEEFLVLCPDVGREGAATCAEHLRKAVEESEYKHKDVLLKVTVSLGVAERDPSMTTPDDLLKEADDALYAAKEAGRNQVAIAAQVPSSAMGCTSRS